MNFKAIIRPLSELENDMKSLSNLQRERKCRFCRNDFLKDNEEIFTFGKHKGVKVDKILEQNRIF
jgi:DNA polymerase-3 subunit epsilon